MKQLIFIDTNIFLDFYRMGNEARARFIQHLEKAISQIIMTRQVLMEFKNNRQRVIIKTINSYKLPDQIQRPGLLSEDRTYEALKKDILNVTKRIKALKERMKRILTEPQKNDPIYKLVHRIYKNKSPYVLNIEAEELYGIKGLAQQRFILGYPPRKNGDTSAGDSVNWEWIVSVSKRVKPDEVLIVSRDSDFGDIFDNSTYLNDWLKQEFKERVGRNVCLKLYSKLADALKDCKIEVSAIEEKSEECIVHNSDDELFQNRQGKCSRCGGSAMFDAICNKCGSYVLCDEDGENFSLDKDGILWSFTHHEFDSKVKCRCGSDSYEIEWHSLCSYCDYVFSKDD